MLLSREWRDCVDEMNTFNGVGLLASVAEGEIVFWSGARKKRLNASAAAMSRFACHASLRKPPIAPLIHACKFAETRLCDAMTLNGSTASQVRRAGSLNLFVKEAPASLAKVRLTCTS